MESQFVLCTVIATPFKFNISYINLNSCYIYISAINLFRILNLNEPNKFDFTLFDNENYGLWKKKMMLFLQVANPNYLDVLKNGPKIPMVIVAESIENNVVVIAVRTYPKEPADYTLDEKEDASLDINLQLILVESLDPIMYNHVVNCKDAKHIWETVETINEGTKEVRENRLEILTFKYEHFKSTSGEGISEGFERYNKLINKLNLQGKFYTQKEINKNFLLTLLTHLEHGITAIRESRDMNQNSLWKDSMEC